MAPDLIIANKEENKQYDINRIRGHGIDVFVTSAITIEQAMLEMRTFISLFNSNISLKSLNEAFLSTKNASSFQFVYLVWNDPLIAAGPHTYISSVLQHVGGINLVTSADDRYPRLAPELLVDLSPDIVFLPDEPYPFQNKHQIHFSNLLPDTSIQLVDGKLASWYNLRLIEGLIYYSNCL